MEEIVVLFEVETVVIGGDDVTVVVVPEVEREQGLGVQIWGVEGRHVIVLEGG